MTGETERTVSPAEAAETQRAEFRSYVLGAVLALSLTVLPFAMVHWRPISHPDLLVLIGVCGLLQVVVHLRFFLHLGFSHQREDLQLILFSGLLLLIMVAGTLWIMGSLAHRMGLPGAS